MEETLGNGRLGLGIGSFCVSFNRFNVAIEIAGTMTIDFTLVSRVSRNYYVTFLPSKFSGLSF
jgi:hypothetical protein